ncbi:hypothetical protein AVEN_80710-1 [Araneus ventricosus]|uniref:Uncharacterized protein n=1 Tax=Araneus ventricosus TaxID=182803 RepID=A0A4Y2H159_ARAVE|nr:hypothetical protein AVEN_80710-1 [Araneus ventricosus]
MASSKPFGDYFSERKLAQFSFKITNAVISPIDLSPSEESIPESFWKPIYPPAGPKIRINAIYDVAERPRGPSGDPPGRGVQVRILIPMKIPEYWEPVHVKQEERVKRPFVGARAEVWRGGCQCQVAHQHLELVQNVEIRPKSPW